MERLFERHVDIVIVADSSYLWSGQDLQLLRADWADVLKSEERVGARTGPSEESWQWPSQLAAPSHGKIERKEQCQILLQKQAASNMKSSFQYPVNICLQLSSSWIVQHPGLFNFNLIFRGRVRYVLDSG